MDRSLENALRGILAVAGLVFATWMLVHLTISLGQRGGTPHYDKRAEGGMFLVTGVTPQVAKATGIAVGDVIDYRNEDIPERVRWWQGAPVGQTIPVPITRNGKRFDLSVRVDPELVAAKIGDLLDLISKCVMVPLGLFLIWRGRGARSLFAGLFLYCFALGSGVNVRFVDLPWWQVLPLQFVRALLLPAALLFLTQFVCDLVGSALPVFARRAAVFAAGALSLVIVIANLDLNLSVPLTGTVAANAKAVKEIFAIAQCLAMVLPLATLVFGAVRTTDRNASTKMWWIFGTTLLGFSGPILNVVNGQLTGFFFINGVMSASLIAMAVVYPYAIARHHIVDVSFFVSRAAAFAAAFALVSILVAVTEETLSQTLGDGFKKNILLSYGVAILLALTFRSFEERLRPRIDWLLFSRRHHVESELTSLIGDIRAAMREDDLTAMVATQVQRLAKCRRVAIYLQNGENFVPRAVAPTGDDSILDALRIALEDDQMILRLKRSVNGSEAMGLSTVFPAGAIVFPIRPAGTLFGALVCERDAEEPPFDPDERKLLVDVAHEVGERVLYLRLRSHVPPVAVALAPA